MRGMTDRDTFAAAALTGLLYPEVDDEFAMPYIVGRAYLWADAMLRERGNHSETPNSSPNLDAAPAARAAPESVGTDKAEPLQGLGTGDTQEPVAWGVASHFRVLATSISRMDAVDMQSDYAYHTEIVPLYRSPTLTDAEREAVRTAADAYAARGSADGRESVNAAALRGLLERLGGGR